MATRQRPTGGKFAAVDELIGNDEDVPIPMDESEQDTLIREFEALSASGRRTWQVTWGVVALLAGLFYSYLAWKQHVEPWGERHTGEFRSVISSSAAVTAVLGSQAGAMMLAAAAMLSNVPPKGYRELGCMPFAARQRLMLWTSVAVAAVGAAFWGSALARMLDKHGWEHGARWELLWLPTGPVMACLLCCYVASVLSDTERQVERLRSLKYNFKKL